MKHNDIEIARRTRGNSVLLFITDRCPVGCAHCSVDSRADSPMITDFGLFDTLLDGICDDYEIRVVGISGGEPFSERRGLTKACEALTACNKSIVIYTSGVWAKSPETAPWIRSVLESCRTVYLSTDSFHQNGVPSSVFVHAARQIADAGAWIVVQTLEVEHTRHLLEQAFGTDVDSHAEIVAITPLRNGRGHDVFDLSPAKKAGAMGSCTLAVTPVIRYDGVLTSCCNEEVIMGKGPDRFRTRVKNREALDTALARFKTDPLMRCVASVGLGELVKHPRLQALAEKRYINNCDLCWKVMGEFPALPESDRLINVIAQLGESH